MPIRLLTIGNKMPAWIEAGFADYAKRLSGAYAIELCEIPAEKRTKNSDIPRLLQREGEKLLAAIKPNHVVIALDRQGQSWSTERLASQLQSWQAMGKTVDLLIGGPEGLSPACLQKAEMIWSLSPLTLPHPLVRVILAEQFYRAWSILQHHPYHR